MARIEVELLCSTQESDDTALIAFEASDSDDEDDDYGDIDFFDKWSSTDNWSEEREQSKEDSDDDSGELCFQSQGDTNYKMNLWPSRPTKTCPARSIFIFSRNEK